MLERCQDLFVRKIIVVFLLMVCFSATETLGQQYMPAKLPPSYCKTMISSFSSAKIPNLNSPLHTPIILSLEAARLIFVLFEIIKEKSRDTCLIQQLMDEKLKESLLNDSELSVRLKSRFHSKKLITC
jgi:hypothetical protein